MDLKEKMKADLQVLPPCPSLLILCPYAQKFYTELLSDPEAGGKQGEGQKNGQIEKEKF